MEGASKSCTPQVKWVKGFFVSFATVGPNLVGLHFGGRNKSGGRIMSLGTKRLLSMREQLA